MSFRGLSVTTPAPSVRLTTLARLKSSLGVTSTTYDGELGSSLDRASAAVEAYCGRIFARQVYQETGPAFGSIEFQCKQAPVVALGTVSFDSNVLTDVSIGDRDQGVLYRQDRFDWTAQTFGGLSGGGALWDVGIPIPGQEEPLWAVAYTAGFILPGYDIENNGALKVLSSDNSFNSTAEAFSAIYSFLKDGDIIGSSGFLKAANNGRFTISGTPTASKIAVDQTLSTGDSATATSTDAPANSRSLFFQTLPMDVEQAAIETAKTFYQQRQTDSNIVEKQMGMARLRYSESSVGASDIGLPSRAVGLLKKWIRRVA